MTIFRTYKTKAQDNKIMEQKVNEIVSVSSKEQYGFNIICDSPSTFEYFLKNGGIVILASPDTQDTYAPRNIALVNMMGITDVRKLKIPLMSALISHYPSLEMFLSFLYSQIDGMREFIAQLPPPLQRPLRISRYQMENHENGNHVQKDGKIEEQIQFISTIASDTAITFIEDVEPESIPLITLLSKQTRMPIIISMKSKAIPQTEAQDGKYIGGFLDELFSSETLKKMADSNNLSILKHMENKDFVNGMLQIGVKPDEMARSLMSQIHAILVHSDRLEKDETIENMIFYPAESFSFYVESIEDENNVVKNQTFYDKIIKSPISEWSNLIAKEVVEPEYDLSEYVYSGVAMSEFADNMKASIMEEQTKA